MQKKVKLECPGCNKPLKEGISTVMMINNKFYHPMCGIEYNFAIKESKKDQT